MSFFHTRQWDLGVTYDVVLHWLSHIHVSPSCPHALGWIPREIALGKQAQRRIPKEYLAQVRLNTPHKNAGHILQGWDRRGQISKPHSVAYTRMAGIYVR